MVSLIIFFSVSKLKKFLLYFSLLGLILSSGSCEKQLKDDIALSVARTEVDCKAGSHIITVKASGEWYLSLYFADGAEPWAELSETRGEGNSNRVVLKYGENESYSSRTVMLILTSAGTDVSCTFVQNGMPREDEDPDPGPGGDEFDPSAVPGWMELPAMSEGDGLRFVTHDMTVGGIRTRNYSLYWDKDNLVAHWVAYPLNNWTIGTEDVGRTNAWGYDPGIPRDEQPRLDRGFGGGYDRGHQIPSGDRQNRASNRETFYFSNMTPQIGQKFNQNIWANFESTVRSWANRSDTLYVVTGCVVEGSTKYATDNDGERVTVPVGYFKAFLRYQRNSTIGFADYAGAAFYLEHRTYSENNVTQDMSMSIDDLEKLTGIDFFVNLPDAIGETAAANVEKQSPASVGWWW